MKKILTKAVLACSLAISFAPLTTGVAEIKVGERSNIQPANASISYWEHPFLHVGKHKYSQATGDFVCRREFRKMKDGEVSYGYDSSGTWGWQNTSKRVYSWTGIEITHSRHIWYHRNYGFCVANRRWF